MSLGLSFSPASPMRGEAGGPHSTLYREDGPFRRSALIGLLFKSAFPVRAAGPPAVRSAFAVEAMSRARTLFGLVLLLEERSWNGDALWYPDASPMTLGREVALARTLVTQFDALAADNGADERPCETLLDGILSGFVALFGPGIGRPTFELAAENLSLAGVRRRALILAAAELVNQSMLHGSCQAHHGRFRACLRRAAGEKVEFAIEYEGRGLDLAPARAAAGTLKLMTALLEADLTCRPGSAGGSAVVLRFSR